MKNSKVNSLSINLFLISAFVFISYSLYTPFLSSYFSKAGIPAVQIGILLTIGPVLAIFIQPIWAIISDRTGRRKDVLALVALGSALSMFTYYIGNSFLSFFIATFILSIFSTSLVPLGDTIIIRSSNKHQFDFSKIRLGGTLGYASFVILAGIIVKRNPSIQFALGAAGFTLFLLVVLKLPRSEGIEERASRSTPIVEKVHLKKAPTKKRFDLFAIFESKLIIFVLAFALISQVGLSFNYSFLGVYMTKLGLSESTIGMINCISALSEIPVLLFINRLLRKINSMKIIIFSCFLVSVRIILVTGGGLPFIILSQMLHGITFMTIYFSCAVFISQNVKPENQSQGQSTLSITQAGIASIIGNIAGGALVDLFGLNMAYRFMSLIILVSSLLTVFLLMSYQRKNKASTVNSYE